MGRLEKFGRALWQRVSGRRRRRPNDEGPKPEEEDKENAKQSTIIVVEEEPDMKKARKREKTVSFSSPFKKREPSASKDIVLEKNEKNTGKKAEKKKEKEPTKGTTLDKQQPWKMSQEVVFTSPAVTPMVKRANKKPPPKSAEVVFTAPDVSLKAGMKRGRVVEELSNPTGKMVKVDVSPIAKKKELVSKIGVYVATPARIITKETINQDFHTTRTETQQMNVIDAKRVHQHERERMSDSEGYSTDASILSSLPHLETSPHYNFIDDAGSMGYHSTSELSPFSPIYSSLSPPSLGISGNGLNQGSSTLPPNLRISQQCQTPSLIRDDKLQQQQQQRGILSASTLSSSQPKLVTIPSTKLQKNRYPEDRREQGEFHYSSSGDLLGTTRRDRKNRHIHFDDIPQPTLNLRSYHLPPITKAVTIDQIDRIRDPVDDFLKNNIYKTKIVTTVFESVKGGFEELIDDVEYEIDRWFGKSNMLAVACEVHFSIPEEKRNRHLEMRMKEKILAALRENNKRLLYLKGLGHGKLPIPLAESKTHENIVKDWDTKSVRGVYQRYYARLLPYVFHETPSWHSPFWKLRTNGYPIKPDPEQFLFDVKIAKDDHIKSQKLPSKLLKSSLISVNLVGLSIFGNKRRSHDILK